MDYSKIRMGLVEYPSNEVGIFLNFLNQLENKTKDGKKVNFWFGNVTELQYIDLYKKVAKDKIFIDGDTITLEYRSGALTVRYDYHAYKNIVLSVYPETIFDVQLVCEGDDFSFRKESGKVIYSHKINSPFANKREIIGAYAIIKNSRGEFLETINLSDIEKMRKVARTQDVWTNWLDRMILKSVVKRICNFHFKDIVSNVEKLDNENYDLDQLKGEPVKELSEFQEKALELLSKIEMPQAKRNNIEMGCRKSDVLAKQTIEWAEGKLKTIVPEPEIKKSNEEIDRENGLFD